MLSRTLLLCVCLVAINPYTVPPSIVFVAVKTDGDVDWTWLGVLSPLFVVDFFFAVSLLVMNCSKDDEEQPLGDDQLADQKQEKRSHSIAKHARQRMRNPPFLSHTVLSF
jgi:hypothetical protein